MESFYLEDKTKDLYSFLFPTLERLSFKPDTEIVTNNIMKRDVIIYGAQASGKTGTAQRIIEEACKLYDPHNVNAISCTGSRSAYVFDYGLDKRLVQIFFFDDFTLEEVPKAILQNFFKSRNIWFKKKGVTFGLIIKIFSTHRYHSLIQEFRTNCDVLISKSYPMNPYDESVLRRFYKDEGMRDLALIEKNKADNPYWNSYNIFHTKFNNGIAVIPIATQNFTKDLFLPEELDLILRLKEFGFSI